MRIPVFDLHCDTALALLGENLQGQGSLLRNSGHIDLERAGALGGYAQCFACFTTDWKELPGGMTPEDVFARERDGILREIAANPGRIRQAFSPKDVVENRKAGVASGILTIEGTAGIGFDPARLEEAFHQGFLLTTLTWNERNPLAGSHVTGGGLTDRGAAYVREAQRLGMGIDVSHLSDAAFWQILKITDGPVLASHSNSRAVCPVSRNLTDDMFRAICETGGVAGINLYTEFLGTESVTLDTVCDHVFHFLELDPTGRHICLGGDLDGCEALPDGFSGVQDYNALALRLRERGLGEKTIEDIFWNNALGVMGLCCM